MKSLSGAILLTAMLLPVLAGCRPENYATVSPPPPPALSGYSYDQPALAKTARDNGFRDGYSDGARDRDTGHSFRPGKDDKYEDCPGYYNEMGSRDLYKHYYRDAYQHGYRNGYSRG